MNLRLGKLLVVVISLLLVCGCSPAGNSPVITSLTVNETLLLPLGRTVIECNASGIDGGTLSYNWSASGGTINIQGDGKSIRWTAPADAGDYDITVNVTDAEGGKTTASTVVTVRFNQPPAILSLTSSREKPLPLEVCQLECRTEDPDNDPLSYSWEAEEGTISGEGSMVSWTAPEGEGSYNITVLVEDIMGGSSTTSLTIDVGANCPPVIASLAAWCNPQADVPKAKVLKGKSCSIVCNVSDPDGDELSYTWSTARGSIQGSGAEVEWTAPNDTGKFTVMVTVSDGKGGVASKAVDIIVVSCACSL